MKKNNLIAIIYFFVFSGILMVAKEIPLNSVQYRGPVEIRVPWCVDSVDVNFKSYSEKNLLKTHANPMGMPTHEVEPQMVLGGEASLLHFINFPLKNERFAEIQLTIDGTEYYKIFVDGKETGNSFKLRPGTRDVSLKILTLPGQTDTVNITLSSPDSVYVSSESLESRRYFTLNDVLFTNSISNVSVSPTGNYALVSYARTSSDKSTTRQRVLKDMKSGKSLEFLSQDYSWMPNDDRLYGVEKETDGSLNLVIYDPTDKSMRELAKNIPEGRFVWSADEKYLIYFTNESGPKEDKDIYRVINPEDRQPGWRDRSGLAIYDLATGLYSPLTFGNKNVSLQDISPDGSKLLIMTMRNRFEKRPTTVFSLYELNLNTMCADTLVFEDGFISRATYSPDGTQVAIKGSPEAFDGIGKNLPDGRIPSMTEGEIYIMDIQKGAVEPITKYFNPSVQTINWNKSNGNLYLTAEDKDRISLFEYNQKSGKINPVNVPEDIVLRYSFADKSPVGLLVAESVSNPQNLYKMDYKKDIWNLVKLEGVTDNMLSEVLFGEVRNFDFVNSKGDTINGRYYLPPNFDPQKKYPLIVNYYGGCSPTSRNFATRYPHHIYANHGYVVYVINPSGATGFGQEFASRHVNTAGEGVAEDIIEGTQKILEELPFVDSEKIGCIGASYGGFMTQYLQTVTDMFAAAISHAGISDHTSYWGNGYWGYSYSETSMADSYPWSDTDLYVKQSPLYNADKINTPILFLHGDGDTNVPPAESIQLFTALKLLGKDTALVEVADQNHHILDFDKRQKWQDTIFAWFAKYLQEDPSWWNELYPTTSLE